MKGKAFFKLRDVVVFKDQRVLHDFGRHASTGWVAEGGQARAGLYQQRIGMAVVAAFKLDNFVAARGSARQTQSAHGGFGTGADQTHHFYRWHEFDDFFGQFNLALGGGAKRETFQHGFLY